MLSILKFHELLKHKHLRLPVGFLEACKSKLESDFHESLCFFKILYIFFEFVFIATIYIEICLLYFFIDLFLPKHAPK